VDERAGPGNLKKIGAFGHFFACSPQVAAVEMALGGDQWGAVVIDPRWWQ
jgi:hypothetical protein